MAITKNTLEYTQGTHTYAFTFPYLKESDVKVRVDGDLINQNNYEVGDTSITFNPGTTFTTGDEIIIYRDTDIDSPNAKFFSGSSIRARDLNSNFDQANYTLQEVDGNVWKKTDGEIVTAPRDNFDPTNLTLTDEQLFTAKALALRHDAIVSMTQPTPPTDGGSFKTGKIWLQPDDDLTLSMYTDNGWRAITSGGTFNRMSKVVYVDAENGDDVEDNAGDRISRPLRSIKYAIEKINARSDGDGCVVSVAPGVYQESCPIQIEKKNVSVIGEALRSCIVHPTSSTETSNMFEVNSGSYIANLTLTGMKAGTGTGNSLDSVLPVQQGWNVAFLQDCVITKSPYVYNCTNFSDSQIDNSNLNATNPAGGLAGDLTSAPTGGGMCVDGSVPLSSSPLRSMVCDSYTHVGLNGPGILVTNNGYVQATSSYAFFNKYHIKCLNGGQANLAASTTDFGEFGLVADGKSPNAVLTANTVGTLQNNLDANGDPLSGYASVGETPGSTAFVIDGNAQANDFFGTTIRPANNMVVEISDGTNTDIYTIEKCDLPADDPGANMSPGQMKVHIVRPSSLNSAVNLGLIRDLPDNVSVSFYLRSQVSSSGHTMEYVGSGTDYRALPENGGVPIEDNQVIELNNGKVYTAITDERGKFKVGGNQNTDPIFQVDQLSGAVRLRAQALAIEKLIQDLNVNAVTIRDTVGDLKIESDVNLDPTNNNPYSIKGVADIVATDTTNGKYAANRNYVDTKIAALLEDSSPSLGGDLNVTSQDALGLTRSIVSSSNNDIKLLPDGTGKVVLGANVSLSPLTTSDTHSITGVSDLTGTESGDHVANKNYADTKVALSGGTMTGELNMGGQDITNVGNITINGATTTINSQTLTVDDPQIELAAKDLPATTSFTAAVTNNHPDLTEVSQIAFEGLETNFRVEAIQPQNGTVTLNNDVYIQSLTAGSNPANNTVTLSGNVSLNQIADGTLITFTVGHRDQDADTGGFRIKGNGDKIFEWQRNNNGHSIDGFVSNQDIAVVDGKQFEALDSNGQPHKLISLGTNNNVSLPTVEEGTWEGTEIAPDKGGTGLTTAPTATQLLVGNSSNEYELRTLSSGTNTTVDTTTAGQIAIDSTDTQYSAGTGISIDAQNAISVDSTVLTNSSAITFSSDVTLTETQGTLAKLKFSEQAPQQGTANTISFEAPQTLSQDYSYVLPTAYPTGQNQVLGSDTSGTLSWVDKSAAVGGNTTDPIFILNGRTVTVNYTIPANKNAMSAGPISISQGVTVDTTTNNATWTIV